MTETELIEQLADKAHDSWSHWMIWLFQCSHQQPDGSMLIPPELVSRWQRQASTDYADLSEQEKDSDRDEARKLLPVFQHS